MEQILDSKDNVKGEIYCITNTTTQKKYIGQTVTHRKNHGKYRPFGSVGRFKDHVSEAVCNTKRKQCWYLNSAIRKYGAEVFVVNVLEQCELAELDSREKHYISQHNTIYPNGYNLTAGGKTLNTITIEPDEEPSSPGTRGGCDYRSQETRDLISNRLRDALSSSEARSSMSEQTRQQHLATKLERFKDIQIDTNQLDQYIRRQQNRVVVNIENHKATFASKHSTPEERYTHARNFLLQITNSATLPN